ncbi:uncharacterized protein LOC135226196 [Macrobrachium nipponense]|uniref:uncharacterized protein LOC135226196 n=1 Tax=Macrobrachium nipponense TaxID=159736 RepID=UPI0030C84930
MKTRKTSSRKRKNPKRTLINTEQKERSKHLKKEIKLQNKLPAKAAAFKDLYENVDMLEGQRNVHRIANARDKATKDLTHIKQIEDRNGKVLTKEGEIKSSWREYFENLLKEENSWNTIEEEIANEREVPRISRREVRRALSKMKKGKGVGPDGIPVEVWRCLGKEGINILWDLFNKIYQQEKISDAWRNSLLIPIYKDKGDIQDCTNYRGIKLMAHTLKVYERIREARLRDETSVSEEQFGFMLGKGTTDAIFVLQLAMENIEKKVRNYI